MIQTHFFNSKTFQYLTAEELQRQQLVEQQLQQIVELLEKRKDNR